MNNNQTMISAAMLEAVWQSRKKDMIDLITPFVMYATATLTSPGEKVDIQKGGKIMYNIILRIQICQKSS